jgi:hypothetical protein
MLLYVIFDDVIETPNIFSQPDEYGYPIAVKLVETLISVKLLFVIKL